jgi:dTMP kinase
MNAMNPPLPIDPAQVHGVFRTEQRTSGTLITVCGFDGSGKTTQMELLAERLRAGGRDVVVTRQPTDWYRNDPAVRAFLDDGAGSEHVRILALMAAADRLRHVAEVIDPALEAGKAVICDRYVFATIVLFTERGIDNDFLVRINEGIPRPDFAFYLDVPTPILQQRLRARDGMKLKHEERSAEFIDRIRTRYATLWEHLIVVDGDADRATIQQSLTGTIRASGLSI